MSSEEDEKILAGEVESWKGFQYALRKPNATLFYKMLTACLKNEEYVSAFKTKGSEYSTESLFMALIFRQQKMIRELINKIGSDQNNQRVKA